MDNLVASGAEYLLIAPRERPFLVAPEEFKIIGEVDGWYLFNFSSGGTNQIPDHEAKKLLGQSDEDGLLAIDDTLLGKVGLTELYMVDWGVENDGTSSFKWLGEGLTQGLRGFLWAEEAIPVVINFQLSPGPSREDQERNLKVYFFRYGAYGPTIEGGVFDEFRFDKSEKYSMQVNLQAGLNEFRILCTDRASIPVLPGGDNRPLLVSLSHIEILPLEMTPELFSIHKSLDEVIGVSEHYLVDWGLEYVDGVKFQWLGEGVDQGFRANIWSEKDINVHIVLHLVPGPSREDLTRNLRITLKQQGFFMESNQIEQRIEFDSPIPYEMEVQLYQGFNVMTIEVLDEANIDMLPNGDTSPLLVQLQKIELLPIHE